MSFGFFIQELEVATIIPNELIDEVQEGDEDEVIYRCKSCQYRSSSAKDIHNHISRHMVCRSVCVNYYTHFCIFGGDFYCV